MHDHLYEWAIGAVIMFFGLAAWLWRWALKTPNVQADHVLRLSSEDPRHPMN